MHVFLRSVAAGFLVAAAGCGSTGSSDFAAEPGPDVANQGNDSVGGEPSVGPPGAGGATPGGAQDIAYARALIEQGAVPSPDSMTVEGLLSEHDIPVEGPPCDKTLCARPASALVPSIETGKTERWVQIGMTSGLASFHRPPMDAVVLLDRSGAMSVDIAQTTASIGRIIDQLRDDDRLAILTFDDAVATLKPMGPVGDRAALKAQVSAVTASGGANMAAGLTAAFDAARGAGKDPARLRRVMILSCGYPDAAANGPGTFADIVAHGADEGIGLSFYGVLLGFDFRLADALSHDRGGTYSYAEGTDQIVKLFDTDFDEMVTPIAYDLKMSLELPSELSVARLYGVPGAPNGSADTSFEVATAFISHKRGAIVARLAAADGAEQAGPGSVHFAYDPETAVSQEAPTSADVPIASFDAAQPTTLGGLGVRKAAFLVNELEGMRKACAAYQAGDRAQASKVLADLLALMKSESAALGQPDLGPEIALVEKLAINVTH